MRRSCLRILVLIALSFAVVHAAAVIMLGHTINDENMYIAASELLKEYSIYKDFAFLQTPYTPYFYMAFRQLCPTDGLLTAARLFKVLTVTLFLIVLYVFFRRLSKSDLISALCVLLITSNEIFSETVQFCRNYDLALLFVIAGFLMTTGEARISNRRHIFCSGLFAGLAIGVKLTFVFVPLCYLIQWIGEPGLAGARSKKIYIFLFGLFVALLPAILLMAQAGFEVSYFNNVEYHRLNTEWRTQTGYSRAMSMQGKLEFFLETMATGSNLLAMFVLGVVLTVNFSWSWFRTFLLSRFFLFTIGSMTLFIIPTPVWGAYFFPFIVSLFILTCQRFGEMNEKRKYVVKFVLLMALLILILPEVSGISNQIVNLFHPDQWTGARQFAAARALRQIIPERLQDRPVATLTPLYVLEAGFKVYPEMSTGPFSYRIADQLCSEQRQRFRIIGPSDIPEYLKKFPPSAILTGFERDLEQRLVEFALKNGYTGFPVIEGPYYAKRTFGTVYVRLDKISPERLRALNIMYKNFRQCLNNR